MLAIYRVGIFRHDSRGEPERHAEVMQGEPGPAFLGMFNLFSGGALEQLSIFALNIMPYVSASIILSLMSVV